MNGLQAQATTVALKSMPTPAAAPVQLEVNRTGLWHKVLEFDANDKAAEQYMREAVELLGAIDRATAFRVVARTITRDTLLTYSGQFGWNPA